MFRPVLPCFGDLLVLVLVEDELCGLTRGVNDERVTVEPFQHDGVLCTQVVRGQRVGLPSQPLISIRQVLWKKTRRARTAFTKNLAKCPAQNKCNEV